MIPLPPTSQQHDDIDMEQLQLTLEERERTMLLERAAYRSRIRSNEGAAEYATRLFACGDLIEDAASKAGIAPKVLREFLHTEKGKETLQHVREELDEEFKNLYAQAIEVMRSGMRHANPQVALAAAGLFMRHAKELKVVVDLTAEDLVQRIMKGALDGGKE